MGYHAEPPGQQCPLWSVVCVYAEGKLMSEEARQPWMR